MGPAAGRAADMYEEEPVPAACREPDIEEEPVPAACRKPDIKRRAASLSSDAQI